MDTFTSIDGNSTHGANVPGIAAVDVGRIEIESYFATALSRASGVRGFLSFRSFPPKPGPAANITPKPGPAANITAVVWTGDIKPVIDRAEEVARHAAAEPLDGLSCATAIPVALFRDGSGGKQSDIVALLGIVIDCDERPNATHRLVKGLLSVPTLIVRSGGVWADPGGGKPEAKRHLLYLFDQPVTDLAEIARVWQAHKRLVRAIDADRSATVVHPYRYPGGLWRKHGAPPRLVTIARTTDRTITVTEFLDAVEGLPPGSTSGTGDGAGRPGGPTHTEAATDTDLIAAIVEGHDLHDSLTRLAWRLVSSESNPVASRGSIVAELHKTLHRSTRKQSDPDTWQARYDDVDRLVGDAIAKQLKERAAIPADPLTAKAPPQEPYPSEKLPPDFRKAVEAMARVSEVAVSMTAPIALAAAATSVALLRPGVSIDRRLTPLSLFVAEIAGSSERKTTVDNHAFRGIREVESTELAAEYRDELQHYNALAAVHDRARKEILGQHKVSRDEKVAWLKELVEPELPKLPRITAADATVEGIRDGLANGRGLFSLVTSEGATLLTGYSLGDKTRRNAAAAMLSALGDGHDYVVSRAAREIRVPSPRFSMSVGLQPIIALPFLGDRALRGQGFVNRLLLSQPPERAGTRDLAKPDQRDLDAVAGFNRRTADRLREGLKIGGGLFGAGPTDKPLVLSAEAEPAWRAFALEMERQQAKGQAFEDIRGAAGKMAEMALRIAGIFALFEDAAATEIDLAMLEAGTTVARWHCNEFRRITEVEPPDFLAEQAERVLGWLRNRFGRRGDAFNARDLYSQNVAGLGTGKPTRAVLNLLKDRGYIRDHGEAQGPVAGRRPLQKYELIPGIT